MSREDYWDSNEKSPTKGPVMHPIIAFILGFWAALALVYIVTVVDAFHKRAQFRRRMAAYRAIDNRLS